MLPQLTNSATINPQFTQANPWNATVFRRCNSSGTTRPASILQQYVQEKPEEICLTRFWRIPFKVLPYARFEAYWRHIGSAAPIVPGGAPFLARLYAAVTVPADRSKECAPRITFRTCQSATGHRSRYVPFSLCTARVASVTLFDVDFCSTVSTEGTPGCWRACRVEAVTRTRIERYTGRDTRVQDLH